MSNGKRLREGTLEAEDFSSSSSSSSSDEEDEAPPLQPQSIDDLPSDDSVSLSDSDEEDDDGSEDEEEADEESDDDDDDDDDEDDDSSDDNEVRHHDDDGGGGDNEKNNLKKKKQKEGDEDFPLEELVRRRNMKGRNQRVKEEQRERKAAALVAAKAALRKTRTQTNSASSAIPPTSDDDIPPNNNHDNDDNDDDDDSHRSAKKAKKKRSKHAPAEASSRRADYFRRGAPVLNSSGIGIELGAHRYKPRDPRMSSMSAGRLDEDHFRHHYAFLQDIRQGEMDRLKGRITAWKARGRRGQKLRRKFGITSSSSARGSLEEDEAELARLTQEKREFERAQLERSAKRSVKRKLREEVAQGKHGAFYLKRKEMRRLELEAKYEELKKKGGDKAVDRALARRRKKNKSKLASLINDT